MDQTDDQIKQSMDEASKRNTILVINPNDVDDLIKRNIGVTSRFIPYSEYIEKLYKERIEIGLKLLHKLPKIDESIANTVINQIYSEIRDSLAFGELSSTIMNSMLLLEFAMRLRMFNKIKESDPKYEWFNMEQMDFDNLIAKLRRHNFLDDDTLKTFNEFKEKYRNTYFHMNVYKMAKGQTASVDRVELKTGKIETVKDMKLDENPQLWFAAKVKFDQDNVFIILDFCIEWANKLLGTHSPETQTEGK